MWSPIRSGARSLRATKLDSRIAVGIVAIVVAVIVRRPLEPILQGQNTFILLEPAIALAAWYGGFASGGTATVAGIAASVFLYLEPSGSSALRSSDFLSLILFSLNGTLLTFLSAGLRRSYERATRARLAAEQSAARNYGLQRIALALNRPMALETLAQTALDQVVELVGASGGLLATGTASDRRLHVRATNGLGDEVPAEIDAFSAAYAPLREAIRTGEPALPPGRGQGADPEPAIAAGSSSGPDSIVLPLLYENRATGAVYLRFAGPTEYEPKDRGYLHSIGAQCGSALARATLIEHADATVAKEQARTAELRTVLEAIGDGLLVGDSEGRVTLANTAAQRLLGKVPARLSDLRDRPPGGADDSEELARLLVRSPVRSRDWLEITHFDSGDDSRSSHVVLIRDVTAAVAADQQRDAFLGVLSHELRTPITTIMVGVDLLRHSGALRRNQVARGLLADIDADATRLNRIVADLLVLTRSERGALDPGGEPVLIHRVVNEVTERERQAWPDVEIKLTVADDLGPVEAEPTYVEQIFRNLLSNALKYGRSPGKPIEVKVTPRADVVEVRVLDRGVGFSPAEADRLFTLFYRNPKVVSAAPGAGIGLYVCRLLAEAMKGATWARPRPGGGAEFGFSLPLMKEPAPPAETKRPGPGTPHARA